MLFYTSDAVYSNTEMSSKHFGYHPSPDYKVPVSIKYLDQIHITLMCYIFIKVLDFKICLAKKISKDLCQLLYDGVYL